MRWHTLDRFNVQLLITSRKFCLKIKFQIELYASSNLRNSAVTSMFRQLLVVTLDSTSSMRSCSVVSLRKSIKKWKASALQVRLISMPSFSPQASMTG